MPFATTAHEDDALDAIVSSLSGATTWRLHADLPEATGTELAADGGYAPVAYSPTQWAASSGGSKVALVDFGIATDAYSDIAPYWAIHDAEGGVLLWDHIPSGPVAVESATAEPVVVSPALFFRDPI